MGYPGDSSSTAVGTIAGVHLRTWDENCRVRAFGLRDSGSRVRLGVLEVHGYPTYNKPTITTHEPPSRGLGLGLRLHV